MFASESRTNSKKPTGSSSVYPQGTASRDWRIDGIMRNTSKPSGNAWHGSGNHLSILLCDVDHFKKYNDTYGHLEGDSCLKAIAGVIANVCRRPADLPARYGGEEFIVSLPDTDGDGALRIAEKIRSGVEDLHMEHRASEKGLVTLSIGTATEVPSHGSEYASLVRTADTALYTAKNNGRNRIERV